MIPELLEKLDNGELSFNPAVELSYLTIEEQKEFIDAMEYTQAVPSISQAQRMKKLSREDVYKRQVRSTKRRVRCLCQCELKVPTDISEATAVHEQVTKLPCQQSCRDGLLMSALQPLL